MPDWTYHPPPVGYTTFEHLLPVYVLVAATITALALSKDYLTAVD